MSLFDEVQKKSNTKASELVNVCVIGRGGAGKSSLLNALTGTELFETGVKTDVTVDALTKLHGQIKFTDLPGYGTDRFRIDSWKEEFSPEKYHLFLFVIDGKITSEDEEFSKTLKSNQSTMLVVRTKDDALKGSKKKGITKESLRQDIRNDVKQRLGVSDVIFTGQGEDEDDVYGVEDLKEKVTSNLDNAHRSAFTLWAKSFSKDELRKKTSLAKKKLESDVDTIIDRGWFGYRKVKESELEWMYRNIQSIYNVTEADVQKHKDIYGVSAELEEALDAMPYGLAGGALIGGLIAAFFTGGASLLATSALVAGGSAAAGGTVVGSLSALFSSMSSEELLAIGEKMLKSAEHVANIIIDDALKAKAEELNINL